MSKGANYGSFLMAFVHPEHLVETDWLAAHLLALCAMIAYE
jgi:hypothetical protein